MHRVESHATMRRVDSPRWQRSSHRIISSIQQSPLTRLLTFQPRSSLPRDRSSVKTAARADMKQFAEKVSKASVSLGVAGAVLAQVRTISVSPHPDDPLLARCSFRTTCRFLFRCPLDFVFCRVVNGEKPTHSDNRESPSGFVCYPRIGWFFPVLVIHDNIWENSVMELDCPELALLLD